MIGFRKGKDWPKCKFCGADLSTYLVIFGKTIFEKCPNKNRSLIDTIQHSDNRFDTKESPWK